MLGAGELLVVGLLVAGLYALLTPLRRRLEHWIARRLTRRSPAPSARVVVLPRRTDGSYGRKEREHNGG